MTDDAEQLRAEVAMLRSQLRAAEDGRTVDRLNAEAEVRAEVQRLRARHEQHQRDVQYLKTRLHTVTADRDAARLDVQATADYLALRLLRFLLELRAALAGAEAMRAAAVLPLDAQYYAGRADGYGSVVAAVVAELQHSVPDALPDALRKVATKVATDVQTH